MTHSARLLVVMLIAFACTHEKGATGGGAGETQAQPAPPQPQGQPQVKSTKKPIAQPTGPHAAPGRPELNSSPAGMMIPGAVEQIQDALKHHGVLTGDYKRGELDNPTAAAIRKFQANHHLAETGVPDHQTVRALGLDVDRVFKPAPGS
jgi:hypothetical protein